jgi:hypothetical protein
MRQTHRIVMPKNWLGRRSSIHRASSVERRHDALDWHRGSHDTPAAHKLHVMVPRGGATLHV